MTEILYCSFTPENNTESRTLRLESQDTALKTMQNVCFMFAKRLAEKDKTPITINIEGPDGSFLRASLRPKISEDDIDCSDMLFDEDVADVEQQIEETNLPDDEINTEDNTVSKNETKNNITEEEYTEILNAISIRETEIANLKSPIIKETLTKIDHAVTEDEKLKIIHNILSEDLPDLDREAILVSCSKKLDISINEILERMCL